MFRNHENRRLISSTLILSLMLLAICFSAHSQYNLPAFEDVECFVFDDGYSNLAGPADAIYFGGLLQLQACIPGGQFGICRRWFGRCRTKITNRPVSFDVFDDGYSNLAGPADAIYFGVSGGGPAPCIPGGQGICRRWFGRCRAPRLSP
jgi:hypothetical protein